MMTDPYDEENQAAFRESIRAGIEAAAFAIQFYSAAELAESRGDIHEAKANSLRALKGLRQFVEMSRRD
jgi:hypothetical protein